MCPRGNCRRAAQIFGANIRRNSAQFVRRNSAPRSDAHPPLPQALWGALDRNGSGLLSIGEFGGFMRLGERQIAEESAPPQLLADDRAPDVGVAAQGVGGGAGQGSGVRRASTMHKLDLSQLMLKLTDDEVVAISRRMNARMAAPADATARQADVRRLQAEEEEEKAARTWIRMFRHVDGNGSGSVCFKELRRLVRDRVHGLGMGDDELPEQELKALWAELDENSSGLISVGEWALHAPRDDRDAVERARRGSRRRRRCGGDRRGGGGHAAHRIAEMREEARGYDEEMLRLRAELESLQSEQELSTDVRAELFVGLAHRALEVRLDGGAVVDGVGPRVRRAERHARRRRPRALRAGGARERVWEGRPRRRAAAVDGAAPAVGGRLAARRRSTGGRSPRITSAIRARWRRCGGNASSSRWYRNYRLTQGVRSKYEGQRPSDSPDVPASSIAWSTTRGWPPWCGPCWSCRGAPRYLGVASSAIFFWSASFFFFSASSFSRSSSSPPPPRPWW